MHDHLFARADAVPALTDEQYDEALGQLTDVLARFQATVHLVTTPDQLHHAITACMVPSQPYIGIDIETAAYQRFDEWVAGTGAKRTRQAAFHPHTSWIRLVQLCPNGRDVYVIDTVCFDPVVLRDAMQTLLAAPGKRMLAHNAVFEQSFFQHYGYTLAQTFSCTKLTGRAQGIVDGLSLEARAKTEFGIDLVKGDATGGSNWASPNLNDLQIRYAAIDALLVFHLFERDRTRLRALGATAEYGMYHDAQPATVGAKLYGVPVDAAALDAYIDSSGKKAKEAQAAAKAVFGGINLASGKQLGEWLTANVSAEVLAMWPRTKSGALGFGEADIGQFAHLPGIRELVQAKACAALHKAALGWRESVNPATGRIHSSLQIAQAATGRYSSSGPNLQNISSDPEARAIFSAKPGHLLIAADYSQIELRLIAVLAPSPVLLETYARGGDVYIDVVKATLGISDAAWEAMSETERKRQRKVGKVLALSLNYRGGPKTLQRALRAVEIAVSLEEATRLMTAYLERTGLGAWHTSITEHAKRTMTMASYTGRVRRFDVEGIAQRDLYSMPANTRIQATGADVMLTAWTAIHARLAREVPTAELVLTVHDEVLVHAPEAVAPQVAAILEAEMASSLRTVMGSLADPIIQGIATPAIGRNWAEVH
jgi:DNA polymerase-1